MEDAPKRAAGLCVGILGPDGSGKSSVIERYVPALAGHFSGVEYFHLRPYLLGGTAQARTPSTDPHGRPPRNVLVSTVKLLYLWADYVLGYYFRVRPLLASGRLVIFDRYYHDLLIDPRRFRYSGSMRFASLLAHLIPLPDLMLVLDAPAEVLQARKQEVPPAESARQAEAYRVIAAPLEARGRAALIDASLPIDDVVRACIERTQSLLAARAAASI
jgi:thymidylate kinase